MLKHKQVNRVFYRNHSQGENPLFIPLRRVASSFHYAANETYSFVKSLKRAGIPVGKVNGEVKSGRQRGEQRYYFIVAQHQARARRAILKDPELKKFLENPVVQIAGPDTQIPTTYQLVFGRGFKHPGQLFAEFGISFGRYSQLRLTEFFTRDCPVPIFKLRKKSRYFYPRRQRSILKIFIKRKLFEIN